MLEMAPRQDRIARLAGLLAVLGLHGAVLYGLWHYRILPPPNQDVTVFVSLLQDTPKPPPEPPRPKPPKPRPVKLDQPRLSEPPAAQQLVSQAQVVSPAEPFAPPPPPTLPAIEAPVEVVAPTPPPPKPAGPMNLTGDLAVVCPQRNPPVYPAISRRLGEEGKVVLRVELNERGQIDRSAIKTSSGYARLDEAALTAIRHWRCNPALREGTPVRAVALQPFNFVLEGR
jgi:protein TonB